MQIPGQGGQDQMETIEVTKIEVTTMETTTMVGDVDLHVLLVILIQ